MKSFLALTCALSLAGLTLPAAAAPQERGTQTLRADNAHQSDDLRTRIGRVEARIGTAERSKAINRAHATDLRGQITRMRQDLSRSQGFVSATRLASYNRTLGSIDVELDNSGVERSLAGDMLTNGEHGFGDDMLTGGAQRDVTNRASPASERHYGNDALPSAEMRAFQRTDARLHYRNARIDHDREGCAVYQGKARDGRNRRERLLSASGKPICVKR